MALLTREEKIAATVFLVMADDFARFYLWKEHHEKLSWQEDYIGFCTTIGYVKKRPICVDIAWAIINNQRVAFYNACSELVDHAMVNDWISKTFNCPKWDRNRRGAECNAMNFHLCLNAIEERNKCQKAM